ncbi:D-2-hydroxyacid dehydrogenase [Antrihabitans sp. YC2-6]|uniref:D-2-hydroxyacid dehydrogenase n=1 Tax=Antrihabitans sp. YC2-6 TaxID=2799498 RepID=UPI0018F2F293|nr:D-2-hydroxyacid dehydrogenase [Antrihabitans sp. YC2-6]MBJ8345721.1 D-2-hydroxyacid dehydrogenase [Antrihabitans sp. YC2-6]
MAEQPTVAVLHADHVPDLAALKDVVQLRFATAPDLAEAVAGADILLVWDFFSTALRDVWPRASALRWVHVASAGVDSLLFDELVRSDVVVTNSRGVFDRLQRDSTWKHRETEQIAGKHAVVVGTGSIGRATAGLLRAVGLRVSGVGRVERENDPDFGTVHASERLAEVVCDADYLVLLAPLTERTRGLVDRKVLAALPASARLINVGRGELVVTTDVVAALQENVIAGAALDVFESEPLPADHPLWALDSVLVTPHMSGDAIGWRDRLAQLFVENCERYVEGRELNNIVDKVRGYVTG